MERQGADILSKVNELGGGQPVPKRRGPKQRRRHNNALRPAFDNNGEAEGTGKKAAMGTVKQY